MSSLWRVSKIRTGGFLAAGALLVGLMLFIVFRPSPRLRVGRCLRRRRVASCRPMSIRAASRTTVLSSARPRRTSSASATRRARPIRPRSTVRRSPLRLKLNPDDAMGLPAYATRNTWTSARQARRSSTSESRAVTTRPITDYSLLPAGYVTADGALHAPAQATRPDGTPTTLYSISNLTFCFDVSGSVSGTVYNDLNQNASERRQLAAVGVDGPAVSRHDACQDHHVCVQRLLCVRLAAVTGSSYTVCEVPPREPGPRLSRRRRPAMSARRSASWLRGTAFTPASATQKISGKDFGNVAEPALHTRPVRRAQIPDPVRSLQAESVVRFQLGHDAGGQTVRQRHGR